MTRPRVEPGWRYCPLCRHGHGPYPGPMCGYVRWELVGMYWREVLCWCEGVTDSVLGCDVSHNDS